MLHFPSRLIKKENVFMTIGIPILNDDSWRLLEDFRSVYHNSAVHVNPIIIRNYKTDLSNNVIGRLKKSRSLSRKMIVTFYGGRRRRYKNIQQLGIALDDPDGRFSPYGYYCDAGQKCFSISSNGDIWRCPAMSGSSSTVKKHFLGGIKDIDSALLSAPEVCAADHCSCNYFTKIRHA